jgi:hypothetical protein
MPKSTFGLKANVRSYWLDVYYPKQSQPSASERIHIALLDDSSVLLGFRQQSVAGEDCLGLFTMKQPMRKKGAAHGYP